jgi:hypothetical protein
VTEVALQKPNADALHAEAVSDLTDEVSRVRHEVLKEYRWMQKLLVKGSNEDDAMMLTKRRRLLFLFVKDLSHGVSGEMLSTKADRDSSVASKTKARLEGVPARAKVQGWVFVGMLDLGMLFYVFLFAMRQTHSRQSAWFQSFVMWLVFEVAVSSTGLVILTHLLIPLYVLADVSKLKEKVLGDLMAFRDKYLRSAAPRDLEEGGGLGSGLGAVVSLSGSVALGVCEEKVSGNSGERKKEDPPSFNAAKYLFVSWRVASLCRELPESKLVLEFNTLWPKKRFGAKKAEVASEYKEAVILTAVSRILLYFLGALLRCHALIQDMIVQTVCNSSLGLLAVWLIGLFAIHPALPVAVVVGLVLFFGILLRIASGKHSELRSRLASVTATKPTKDNAVSHSSGGIITSPPLVSSPQPALEPFQSPSNSQERPVAEDAVSPFECVEEVRPSRRTEEQDEETGAEGHAPSDSQSEQHLGNGIGSSEGADRSSENSSAEFNLQEVGWDSDSP